MIRPDGLADQLERTVNELRRHGDLTWSRAEDWTKSRRIANDSSRGGGVGSGRTDRSIGDQRDDDAAARRREELATLAARMEADSIRMRWYIDDACPDKPKRERENTVAACIVCSGPAVQPRRGMCDACRKAWERADKPDLTAFKKERLAQMEQRVIHEHEVA